MSACPVCVFSHLFYNNTSADWLTALLNNFNVLALDHKGKQWRELYKWLPSPPLRTASLPVRFWFLMGTTLALLWKEHHVPPVVWHLSLHSFYLSSVILAQPISFGVGCFSFCFLVYAKPFDKVIAWPMEGLVLEPFLDKRTTGGVKGGSGRIMPYTKRSLELFSSIKEIVRTVSLRREQWTWQPPGLPRQV